MDKIWLTLYVGENSKMNLVMFTEFIYNGRCSKTHTNN